MFPPGCSETHARILKGTRFGCRPASRDAPPASRDGRAGRSVPPESKELSEAVSSAGSDAGDGARAAAAPRSSSSGSSSVARSKSYLLFER